MKAQLKRLRKELDKTGVLLLTDAELPSLTTIVAGTPVKGSWWGHPQGNLMYNLSNQLMDEPDVLVVKLINKKITFIQQRHWDALIAIGSSYQKWQLGKLAEPAKSLLKNVESKGEVRADDPRLKKPTSEVGKLAAKLEDRLLLYSESIHTDSGKHVRLLRSWENLMKAKKYKSRNMDYNLAVEHFERVQKLLMAGGGQKARMPWQ